MTERRGGTRARRPPALASRMFVSAAATAATIAMVGWIGRASAGEPVTAATTVRRVVVVVPPPDPVPYITLEALLPGRTVTVVTQAPRVVHRAPAASSTA
ncbi:MAG TPA: hypothetical protein VFY15_05550, partial [Acidimicrobiia bacterium]|nr:hypothetical protein [Acidimicrobiia bacterium]